MFKSLPLLLLVISGLFIASCSSTTSPGTTAPLKATISGTVRDSITNVAISGANIDLRSTDTALVSHTLSDVHGYYELDTVKSGTYLLIATAQNHSQMVTITHVATGKSDTVNFSLSPGETKQKIIGIVKDSITNAPLIGASVVLFNSDTVIVSHTISDSHGMYELDTVAAGVYYLVVSTSGYVGAFNVIRVTNGLDFKQDFALIPQNQTTQGDDVQFHVIDATTKKPIAGAAIDDRGNTQFTDILGNSGFYTSSSGSLVYTISATGYSPETVVITFPIGFHLVDTIALYPHADTLLALYRFSNSGLDSSGKGHNGTVHGTYVDDRFGNAKSAIQFNGSSDYMTIPNASDLNFGKSQSFTICFWAKYPEPQQPGNNVYVIRKATGANNSLMGYDIIDNGYEMIPEVGTTYGEGSGQQVELSDNVRWHFFTYVFDRSGSISFYYDGAPYSFGSTSIGGTTMQGNINTAANLLIGGDGTASHSFKGTLDDIRIYEGILDASEIYTLCHENGW